jgi:AraC-like DNA-binding protein
MKVQFFQIVKTGEVSFTVQDDRLKSFYGLLHYHPEIQVTLIISGSGLRIIGDQVLPFGPGSLMMIGENQPHVFRSNPVGEGQMVEAVSIYFNRNAFGPNFFQLPEMRLIDALLHRSRSGLDIIGNTRTYLEDKIIRLAKMEGFRKFSQFLEILDVMAKSSDVVVLSDYQVELVGKDNDADRLNKVFNYVFSHLQEEIRLDQIAEVAHLTPNGFCRFFKKKTRKSFFRFLIEARISKAMEMLRETDFPVSRCAFEAGFGNLSYFNREFLRAVSMTPRNYRLQFKSNR